MATPDPCPALALVPGHGRLRAKPLVATLYGDSLLPHGGGAWLSSVIRLAAPLGLSERMVRTVVFRLRRDGWLEAEKSGRRSFYRLTAGGCRQFRTAEKRIYTVPRDDWDGHWTLVVFDGAGPEAARRALLRELGWSGFAPLAPRIIAYPAREHGILERALEGSGMRDHVLCLAAETRDGNCEALRRVVAANWPLDEVGRSYLQFLERFGRLARRLREGWRPDAVAAFALRTVLIDVYRRTLLRDPALPLPLLPEDWPGQRAALLTRDIYRHLAGPAQAHVREVLLADGISAPADDSFYARFGGLDGGGRGDGLQP
ncbi:MAG: PaaX family transcriptional regulator C-terminal domain-containing protein [Rhodothalassiaceae bacterium]